MALIDGHSSVLLDNVCKLIDSKVPSDRAPLITSFVQKIYGTMSVDDFSGRNDADLYGAALSLWNALNKKKVGESYIRVFNPEVSRDGWQSSHTIIEIVHDDMPFLVDSIRMALSRHAITSHLMLHIPLAFARDKHSQVTALRRLSEQKKSDKAETVFLIEVDRLTEQKVIDNLTDELRVVLADVTLAVTDWQPMQERMDEVIGRIENTKLPVEQEERAEVDAFLKWVNDHNFTLMGYRYYAIEPVKGDYELRPQIDSSLGLMRASKEVHKRSLSALGESAWEEALSPHLLVLTKTNSKSRVHRPAYIDYIGIKRFDADGNVVGEDRFIGLYASSVYNNSAMQIPMIRKKLQRVLENSGFATGSHAYKALMNILETYPRDELIQAKEEELMQVGLGVLQMQERDRTRLFIRKDVFGRYYSCMVYVTKERYNTQLRIATQRILAQALGSSEEVEFTTYFSESALCRTHYLVRVKDADKDINVKEIEANLIEAARSWEDKLEAALLSIHGEANGKKLARKYVQAFPRSYKEEVLPSTAAVDIAQLEALSEEHQLGMLFYRPQEFRNPRLVKLKLFHMDQPIYLSDVMPMLENMGLRIIGERPCEVRTSDGKPYWVLDFYMELTGAKELNLEESQHRFQDAFAKVWSGDFEDDGFNKLVLGSGLTGREVVILRAFAKYMRQIGSSFSQSYIEETLVRYPHLAQMLVQLFTKRFDPKKPAAEKTLEKLVGQINEELDQVSNLDDDRIIRSYVELISATLRTNFFQKSKDGSEKPYISFKMKPDMISDMPLPLPAFEIFVYSPRVEGVHLRGGKVARGGLRWSDRREDFRTEVLGLVKAQQVKNTVIVPVGAKGGFVCKKLPTTGGREAFLNEGKECYRTFIRALLDITDNIVGGDIVPPVDVVRHDEDDPYLVVAADKGTATFSDIANGIAEEYGHWLGDAFASGGSVGYDHKKMGITARGGWESVKRHFREMGIDCQTTDFTATGIGDMAGDVFGNGMLLSKHTRLLAAFNHMHIFIDPEPDAALSFAERERLFNLPTSTWDDYNKELISEGGGIFSRSLKAIKLSPQMKRMLDTKKVSMTPNELMKAILQMEVDLLWNGGIGTYVKAASESNAEVGDRANDAIRINGGELRAKVVGEGGNLGLTQRGRIEYALGGGRINTDFVDNVGGVDCSDNEVNIKILLNTLVQSGDMTRKQRDKLLYDMTDDVARIVLEDCYEQTHSISITELKGGSALKEQSRFIQELEKAGKLDRALEFLPSEDELAERAAQGKGLTRPELSVLTAYSKMVLKEMFNVAEITEDAYHSKLLKANFPALIQDQFSDAMANHPLRGEIIATQLANRITNDMGLNFVHRMMDETGGTAVDIAHSYAMAAAIFDLRRLWAEVTALDNVIASDVQSGLLFELRRTIRRATRWFLRHRNKAMTIEEGVAFYKDGVEKIKANLLGYMVEDEAEGIRAEAEQLVEAGVPKSLAYEIEQLSSLFCVMDIAEVAQQQQLPQTLVANSYYKLGAQLGLHWFLEQIIGQPVTNHWQALARASYREELDWHQRQLTAAVLQSCTDDSCPVEDVVEQWIEGHEAILTRWNQMLSEFRTSQTHEFAKFSVALRELGILIHHCQPATAA
ncbi:MAG: NAD-glutamate dehydrogenase [Pseudomonadota bacterium]|uniref:NAD-glutamate dehydrogenase n=1 Tax=Gallaecimonas pentaromativorans TaxID=584787 RepID=UPI00067F3E72|nr:NAD-glutamate dehydrogenase [Gallaecimonas pentaromativorans]MED5525405.1 NAD-glutamate dehydrogenase [Pseudomonadota bacterium]